MSKIYQLEPAAWSTTRTLGILILTMVILCSSASAELSTGIFVDSWIKDAISGILSGGSQSGSDIANPTSQPDLEEKSGSSGDSEEIERIGGGMLVAPSEIAEKDIILDASDHPTSFIPGAVHISYREFVDNNNTALLKSFNDIAGILGDAGISRNDPLVVYGECQPCGGGPSTATYVYWLLRYIGHDDVRVLNGGIYAWQDAGLPVQNTSAKREKSVYSPDPNSQLYATYEYVMSGEPQIVDARSEAEFESETIPGSINIPYDLVLDGKMIRDEEQLGEIFKNLTKDRPVVVFTTTGTKASASWFALMMLGYDARMYTYKDWRDAERDLRRQSQEINRSS